MTTMEMLDTVDMALETMSKAKQDLLTMAADLRDCRNELCLKCGDYKNAHLGACDGCRWKDVH